MTYTKVGLLEKIASYYKETNNFPDKVIWHSIKLQDMPTWEEVLQMFDGKAKLRTRLKFHISKRVWDKQKLKEGFERFYKEKGHFPTAPEIDVYPYLPSSRNIQRYYGGLVNLRKLFGFEVSDYSMGGYRSKWAGIYNTEGRVSEEEVAKIQYDAQR